MKDHSSTKTAIGKAKAMIEGGWRVVPILPKQKRPAHTGWTEREFYARRTFGRTAALELSLGMVSLLWIWTPIART